MIIFLCRPDVLLREKIELNLSASRIRYQDVLLLGHPVERIAAPLEDIAEDAVFHTCGTLGRADFHYLMSVRHAK
eukprot:6923401-Pyramimonas_sp.AAC.1